MTGYRAYYPTSPVHIGETMGAMALAVYVAICHHAQSSMDCTAGIARLARLSGASIATVKRQIAALENAGHLHVKKRPGRAHSIAVVGWRKRESDPGHSELTPSSQSTTPQVTVSYPPGHSELPPSSQRANTQLTVSHELRGGTTRSELRGVNSSRATPSDTAIRALENRMAIVPREVLEIGIEIDDRHGDAAGDIMRRALDDPFFTDRTVTPRALRNALSRVPPPSAVRPGVPEHEIGYLRRTVARWTHAEWSDAENYAAIRERCAKTLDALGLTDYGGVRDFLTETT